MYVCICSGVTEDDVRGCLAAGVGTTKDVKAACGMKPGCGTCTKRICAMVSEHRTASELVDALTGGPLPLEIVSSRRDRSDRSDRLDQEAPQAFEGGSAPLTAA